MVHQVDFVDRDLNLLAHAQALELDIGSRCGGHGICGADRLKIPRQYAPLFSKVTTTEENFFTASELAQGRRLGCQCFPEWSISEVSSTVDWIDIQVESRTAVG
jgi:ferredoxin